MPSSASAAACSEEEDDSDAPVVSDSDIDNGEQEEQEYEEVEEEVEEHDVEEDGDEDFEEYEVVEEYIEEDEVEVEEDEVNVSDSPIEADEGPNDVCQEIEVEGRDGLLRLGSSSLEKSEAKITSETLAVEESSANTNFSCPLNEPLTRQREESVLNYEDPKYEKSGKDLVTVEDNRIQEVVEKVSNDCSELRCNIETHFFTKDNIDCTTNFPYSITGNEIADAIPMKDHSGEGVNDAVNTNEGIKQMDGQPGHDKVCRESRLAVTDTRTTCLPPGAEIMEGNKWPTVICDFYAKGWCIRGSSCTFLHLKDDLNNIAQKPEAVAAALDRKRNLQVDEGVGDITKRSRSPGFPEPLASSVGNSLEYSSHFTSETILPRDLGESQKWHQFHEKHKLPLLEKEHLSSSLTPDSQQLPPSQDDPGFVSFKAVGRESHRQNWPADNCGDHASLNSGGSFMVRNSLPPEYGVSSSGSVLLSCNYRCGNSSHSSSMDESGSFRNPHMHIASPLRIHSLSSSSNTYLLNSGLLSSHHKLAWTASSLPFAYSAFNTSPLGARKLLDSQNECRVSRSSSLLQSSPLLCGLETENLPLTHVSLRSSTHKTKSSSSDWEPSIPFRPSIFIPPIGISSPESQYDPLCDSIELPKIGDQSFRVSLYSHGASCTDTLHKRKYDSSVLTGTLGPECNNDTISVSSHNKFYENVLEKRCHMRETDSLTAEAERVGTSVVDWQSGTMPKEDNPLSPSDVEELTKMSKIDDDHASSYQDGASRHQKELKLNRARHNMNKMDSKLKMDGHVERDGKVARHFRAALIDLVKELLKPTWRDGHLSKDAHNMIVKKVVDKVLRTLGPHQVPTTTESVEQYLSSFRTKIVKLVEGYVNKYGKS